MEDMAPWKLVKADINKAGEVLYNASEALRISSNLLKPIMPKRTLSVLQTLNAEKSNLDWGQLNSGNKIKEHNQLFPRIDLKKNEKKLIQPQEKESDLVNLITFKEFLDIELKTGKVISAEKVDGAKKLLKLQVQVGSKERQIISGIAEYYSPDDLLGNLIVVVTNLKPAKIFGEESYGMLLAAKKGKNLRLINVDSNKVSSGMQIY